jgi:hypothetical protein
MVTFCGTLNRWNTKHSEHLKFQSKKQSNVEVCQCVSMSSKAHFRNLGPEIPVVSSSLTFNLGNVRRSYYIMSGHDGFLLRPIMVIIL